MNDLELAITATLQDDAREAGMTTDTSHEFDILEGRLDDLDRRRRRFWVGAVVAVAVVVAAAVGILGLPHRLASPPVATTPTPSPSAITYASSGFDHPFRVVLPAWVTGSRSVQDDEGPRHSMWLGHDCSGSCDSVDDFVATLFAYPKTVIAPEGEPSARIVDTPAAYLAQLTAWQKAHRLVITDQRPVQVGGLSGTVMTVTARVEIQNSLSCEDANPNNCWALSAGYPGRLAVLDDGGHTLIIASDVGNASRFAATAAAQFDQMLTTVQFDPVPSPGTS